MAVDRPEPGEDRSRELGEAVMQGLALSPVPAALLGADLRVRGCNRAFLDLVGPRPSPLGEPCYLLFQARDGGGLPLCSASCGSASAESGGGQAIGHLMWCRPRGGATLLLDGMLVPLEAIAGRGDGGVRFLHLFRPVTAASEVARAVADLSGLYQSAVRGAGRPEGLPGSVPSPLSRREVQVLSLLQQGLATDAAAARLRIRRSTLRNHVQRLLGKLRAHSRLEAVLTARRNGWL